MKTIKMQRLTRFVESQKLRGFLYDLDLSDLDAEIINLVFQLETASEQLEKKIKLLYIRDYYGNGK